MSKRSKNFFSSLTIAHKTTMMYGGIFSLSLLFISFFVLINVNVIEQNNVREEIVKIVQNIDDYIESNGTFSQQALDDILKNKYVEVNVIDVKNHTVYKNSVGETPPFIRQIPSQLSPEQIEEWENPQYSRPKEWEQKGFKVSTAKEFHIGGGRQYFITGRDGKEFVLIEKEIKFQDNNYLVQAFKMLSNNNYYFHTFALRLLLIDVLGIFLSFLMEDISAEECSNL